MQLPGGYLLEVVNMLGFSNSAEFRSQLLCPPGANSWSTACPAGGTTIDRHLPIAAVQPGYFPALEVLVPTQIHPHPVDVDRLLLIEWVGIQLDTYLWSQMVSARLSGTQISSSYEWQGICQF